MASDTPEIRKELDAAWRAVRERLVASGYARAAVVETMMGVALGDLDELYGLQDATRFILKARSFRRRISEPGRMADPAGDAGAAGGPPAVQPIPNSG